MPIKTTYHEPKNLPIKQVELSGDDVATGDQRFIARPANDGESIALFDAHSTAATAWVRPDTLRKYAEKLVKLADQVEGK